MKSTSRRLSRAGSIVFALAAYAGYLTSALAAPVAADVVVVMDESGSMEGEQEWMAEVIPFLDESLIDYGVGAEELDNCYGLVGFGNASVVPRSVPVGGKLCGSAADFAAAAATLVIDGGTEDGWAGLDYALDNYPPRSGAALNVLLVTDEDRDNTDATLSLANLLESLNERCALVNAVLDVNVLCADGTAALGMDARGNGYVPDGFGGFTLCSNAQVTSSAGTTLQDYVPLALDTQILENGGAVWDLNVLRQGGLFAQSFTAATLAIKVDEILNQCVGDLAAIVQVTPNPALVGQTVVLDGTQSFQADPLYEIASWDWDFDGDGTFDATGPIVETSFGALGTFPVTLRVTDNSPDAKQGFTTVPVEVNLPPVRPTALVGGPYAFCPGQDIILDASGSVNPDDSLSEPGMPPDELTAFQWDLDDDLIYDDATGAVVDATAAFAGFPPGEYFVRLEVADNTAAAFPSSGLLDLTDTNVGSVTLLPVEDPSCGCAVELTASVRGRQVNLEWTSTGTSTFTLYRRIGESPYSLVTTTSEQTFTDHLPKACGKSSVTYRIDALGSDSAVLCSSEEVRASSRSPRRPPRKHGRKPFKH